MARTAQEIEEDLALQDMADKAKDEEVEPKTVDSEEINSSEDSIWGELEDEFKEEDGEEVEAEAKVEEEVLEKPEEVSEEKIPAEEEATDKPKEEAEEELPPKEEIAEETITEEPLEGTAQYTPEELQQMRTDAESEIAGRYALSEEDAEAMVTEPEQVLPKLAARMYLDIYDGIMANLQQRLPDIIENTTRQASARQQDTQDFYSAWPQLDQKSHSSVVQRLGQVYRQSNPQASKEQFINEVGAIAMVNLKIPFQEDTADEEVQARPFTPAAASSAPASKPIASQTGDNVFTDLAAEFDEEDL